jgi:hypothetical protein
MGNGNKNTLDKAVAAYENSGIGKLTAKMAVAEARFFGGDTAAAHEQAGVENARKGETGAALSERWKAEKEVFAHIGSKIGIGGEEAHHSGTAPATPNNISPASSKSK